MARGPKVRALRAKVGRGRDAQKGATLLEVMISLLIMAMSAGAIAAVLFSLGQAGRQTAGLDAGLDHRLAISKLETLAEEMPAAFVPEGDYLLKGDKDQLVFYSVESVGATAQSTVVRVLVRVRNGQLVAEISRQDQPAEQVVLADGAADLKLSYWGAHDPGRTAFWHDRWEGAPRLPRLVRLDWQSQTGPAIPILLQPANFDRWRLRHLTNLVPRDM